MKAKINPSRKDIFRIPHLGVGFSWGGPLDRAIPENFRQSQFVSLPVPPPLHSHHYWMLEAFKESLKGIGITNPNPAVGCIIVDATGRKELARGSTQKYGGLHAETFALNQLHSKQNKTQLKNATLYVTLEPCAHQGNQPPCVDRILASPIRRIVIARQDPHSVVNGEGIRRLRAAGKEVILGPYANEVTAWNYPFFLKMLRSGKKDVKRPVIALKWAQTLDGQLADDQAQSKWITGPVARSYTHWLRQRYDGILIGAGTLLKDHPTLTARDCDLAHQNDPLPIILDPRGRCLDLSVTERRLLSKTVFHPDRKSLVLVSEAAWKKHPSSWLKKTKNIEVQTFPAQSLGLGLLEDPTFGGRLPRPLQSILVEGGPKTLSFFLKAQCVDVMHVMIAPILTGGLQNRVQLQLPLASAQRFELVSQAQLGADTLLELVPTPLCRKLFQS